MTYQEQYDIFDWLFSSIDELIDCNYLTNTMEDKTEQKCLKEKPPCTETVQGKETEENQMTNYEKIKSMSLDKTAEFLANNFDESSYQIRDWLEEQCMQCIEVMTNYRNLRSSSLDEMARILGNMFSACKMCPHVDEHGNCTDFSDSFDCINALKEWLKAESEEE